MHGQLYRLTAPVLTIEQAAAPHKPVTIPEDSTIRVVGQLDGSKFVTVEWDGRTTNMFLVDLEERAMPVEAAAV